MKRAIIFIGAVVILGILILLKFLFFPGVKEHKKAGGGEPVIPVECYVARDTSVNYQLETVGTLRANEQVEIVSEISRKVTGIFMKEGSLVTTGQMLFKLDDSDITSRIKKLTIESGLAEANETRGKVLLSKGGMSQERYDELANIHNTLEAEIEILKVDLSKTEIRAPFPGRIGLRNVSVGALVSPGVVLANLQDISRIKVDFAVPERYSHNLKVGSKIVFRTDYYPGDLTAIVEAVEPAVDERTRTLLIRALSVNEKGILVPGTSARIYLTLEELTKSIFIPTQGLIPSIKGYSVFLKKEGQAFPVLVKTGVRNSDFVQITEGIGIGDTVVVTNLLRVRKGSPLKTVKIS